MRRNVIAIGVAVSLGLGPGSSMSLAQTGPERPRSTDARVRELRAAGLDLLYNLDHVKALGSFEEAITLRPDDPALHRLAASVLWMSILFEWGAILVDDYLGQAKDMIDRPRPPANVDRAFHEHIARSLALGETALRARESDPDANYQVGASSAFLASYIATVEGRLMGSIGSARRAFRLHQRVLALSPSRKDAGFVPGMYRYSLSAMSMPMRLLARLAGIDSDRARGLRQVEDAAAFPSDAQPDALFILILLYNRENRYEDALRAVRELQRRYPRNRLLWLEGGTTALRAGDVRTARAELEHGLTMMTTDSRRRARGEEARWRVTYGTTLVSLDRREAAHQLSVALTEEAPAWVHGRARKELGKVADLEGQRDKALEEYRLAVRLCRAGNDRPCEDEAAKLIRTPHH